MFCNPSEFQTICLYSPLAMLYISFFISSYETESLLTQLTIQKESELIFLKSFVCFRPLRNAIEGTRYVMHCLLHLNPFLDAALYVPHDRFALPFFISR